MIRILTIVGTRPQIIKYSALARAAKEFSGSVEPPFGFFLVHTGQHFDPRMSRLFFDELSLSPPHVNLEVGEHAPGIRLGKMIAGAEKAMKEFRPDCVLTIGDTDSTLAGALAAARTGFPLGHIEAGVRSGNRNTPEEINRIATDHLSRILFCPSRSAMKNCSNEGITKECILAGDILLDSLLHFLPELDKVQPVLKRFRIESGNFILFTIHRAENTAEPEAIESLLRSLDRLDCPVLFPVHPRTRKLMRRGLFQEMGNVIPSPPLPYLETLFLVRAARCVLTDSGGIQREGFYLGTPVVVLREETEWPETLTEGRAALAGISPERVVEALGRLDRRKGSKIKPFPPVYGRGNACSAVLKRILKIFS